MSDGYRRRQSHPYGVHSDVSFGLRHPIVRELNAEFETGTPDPYNFTIDLIDQAGREFFGKREEPVVPLMEADSATNDEIIILPVAGSKGHYAKPFSILKPNGTPALAILDKHRVADKKNRRTFGWTDRDILRIHGDVERALGRLLFLDVKPVEFDRVHVHEPEKNGDKVAKIALMPSAPWELLFAREQEIAHETTFKGNGRVAPMPESVFPHLNVVRMARSVSLEDTYGFAEAIAALGPQILPVGPLEFYDNATIKLGRYVPKDDVRD